MILRASAYLKGPCGDSMSFTSHENKIITDIKNFTDGCGATRHAPRSRAFGFMAKLRRGFTISRRSD
jgi:hypothetical protein